jgi:2-polyprenyl-3-methyl-5-hydroxy-6-metoxy-1,4-benzoquinol methylase
MSAIEPALAGGNGETEVLRNWGDDELGPANGSVGQELTDLIVKVIRAQAGVQTICDLGCGNGYLASRLAESGHTITGVDASERLLAIAARYRSSRTDFRLAALGPAAVEQLRDRGPFDLVVSVDVVEHLYRPASLIETATAILKPGGIAVICTPYHGYLKNLAISLLDRWDDHHGVHFDGGHIKFFSVRTLTALMGPSFAVEGMRFYGRFPGFWKNMICVARKRAV